MILWFWCAKDEWRWWPLGSGRGQNLSSSLFCIVTTYGTLTSPRESCIFFTCSTWGDLPQGSPCVSTSFGNAEFQKNMLHKGSSFWQKSLLTTVDEVTKTGKTKSRRWHTDWVSPCVGKTPQCFCCRGIWWPLWLQLHPELHCPVLNFSVRATDGKQRNILFLSRPINKPTSYFEGQIQSWTSCNFPPSMLSDGYIRTGALAQDRNMEQPLCSVFWKEMVLLDLMELCQCLIPYHLDACSHWTEKLWLVASLSWWCNAWWSILYGGAEGVECTCRWLTKCIISLIALFPGRLFHHCHPHWKALRNPEVLLLEIHGCDLFSWSLASHKQTNAHALVVLVTSKQLH